MFTEKELFALELEAKKMEIKFQQAKCCSLLDYVIKITHNAEALPILQGHLKEFRSLITEYRTMLQTYNQM